MGPVKPKRTVTVKVKVNKYNFKNISNKDETNMSFQSGTISLEQLLSFYYPYRGF